MAHLLADAQAAGAKDYVKPSSIQELALESKFSYWVSSNTGQFPGPAWTPCP